MTHSMASPWQRHLLAAAETVEEEGEMSPLMMLVLAAAACMLLMLVVMQCVCSEKSSAKENRGKPAAARSGETPKPTAAETDPPVVVVVDIATERETTLSIQKSGETPPVNNGVVPAGRNGIAPSGHSRNASSGSGQMRPTSLRELPDLPVGSNHKRNLSGAGVIDSSATTHASVDEKEEDGSAYDHLGAKITANNSAAVNYDHITLESPHDPSTGTTPQSEVDTASEGHYAQVRERTYDVVKDVRARASANLTTSNDYDPYAKVKDEDDDKEDPYAKVKDTEKEELDDDYAHLRHDHVAISTSDITPQLPPLADDEDPYERVIGDSGGARVISTAGLPDPDYPYSVVSDQSSATVVSISRSGASPPKAGSILDTRASANRNNSASSMGESESHLRLQYADDDGAQNDYATVVKDRNPSTSRMEEAGGGEAEEKEEIEPYSTSPPEPPRLYGASEVDQLFRTNGEATDRDDAKERRYTKVTARESLASMSARNALNTYEVVPDLPENTYATVDGGSGDGVVRYATPGAPSLQHSASELSETYAEIGASGSGSYAVPAPEPPSLDSLHSMTKSTTSNDGDHGNSRPPTSPSASNVIIAEDGYAVVSKSGFSPSETALPQIPRAGTSSSFGSTGSLGEEKVIGGVTLHTDYHSVKDCIPDQDSENDPNYESVDEALSKSPATVSKIPSASVSKIPASASKIPSTSKIPGSASKIPASTSKIPASASKIPASASKIPAPASKSTSSAVMPVHSSTATANTPRVTIVNHKSPARVHHQYEEVSPPSSPPMSPSASSRIPVRMPSLKGASGNSKASEVKTPGKQSGEKGQAAEVRDRVLQGHMYEAISDVKRPSALPRRESGKKVSSGGHNVKL